MKGSEAGRTRGEANKLGFRDWQTRPRGGLVWSASTRPCMYAFIPFDFNLKYKQNECLNR